MKKIKIKEQNLAIQLRMYISVKVVSCPGRWHEEKKKNNVVEKYVYSMCELNMMKKNKGKKNKIKK